jgi:hypothetical protein
LGAKHKNWVFILPIVLGNLQTKTPTAELEEGSHGAGTWPGRRLKGHLDGAVVPSIICEAKKTPTVLKQGVSLLFIIIILLGAIDLI